MAINTISTQKGAYRESVQKLNDLPECIISSYNLFTDDHLLYRKIESAEDCRPLATV